MRTTQQILDSCFSIITEIGTHLRYDTRAGVKTQNLINEINELSDAIEKEYPYISGLFKRNIGCLMTKDGFINAYCFGNLEATINILKNLSCKTSRLKIFISHSSKDKVFIEKFVDHILKLGLNFSSDEIFCTSIEETGIKNGEDIREHIRKNMLDCDIVFLMLSKNYRNSEICLNEMGAVWACDKKVYSYVFPDVDFGSIGWLYEVKRASKINDRIALDALYDDLAEYYSLPKSTAEWGRQREQFLEVFF